MIALESILCPNAKAREEFAADCLEVFASAAGKRLLASLVAAAHPLQHTPGMSEHEHGRREVVATLWRFGASSPNLPDTKPTIPPTS